MTLAALFVLLFTSVYLDRMRRAYWGFAVISGAVLLAVMASVEGVVAPLNSGDLYRAEFRPLLFEVFLVYLVVYAGVGNWNLYRLYKIVRETSKPLARRAAGLLITFSLTLVLGLITNGFLEVSPQYASVPRPFSTLLGLVAGQAYYTLYPIGRPRIAEAIRRFQARRYLIKAVFLTYEDGTLIGSKARPGETAIDQDLFGATLDVIQNFMRTSFPMLHGKSLSAIVQGPYVLVMERARYAYLTVVLEGQESDQLRRQMRDLLLSFEDRNREVLSRWQGIPSQAQGTDEMLSQFFVEVPFS